MKRPRSKLRLSIERLEMRQLLATLVWAGGGRSMAWSDSSNWLPETPLTGTDSAYFGDRAATRLVGDVTNTLDQDFSISGLAYGTTGSAGHTSDLGGHELQVQGSVSFNADRAGSGVHRLQNGSLVIDSWWSSLNAGGGSTADLSGLSQWTAELHEIVVGSDPLGDAELLLAMANDLELNALVIGEDDAAGSVTAASGGSLQLGSSLQPTLVLIGQEHTVDDTEHPGRLDLSRGGPFDAQLAGLVIAQQSASGRARGTLLGGNSGVVTIGSQHQPGQLVVGQTTGSGSASGDLDLRQQTRLVAHLEKLAVGQQSLGEGAPEGTVRLARENRIEADSIVVGDGGRALLRLGTTNSIVAAELEIAKNGSQGAIEIPNHGTLELGSELQSTLVSIADDAAAAAGHSGGQFDLTGAAEFNALLDDVIVARKFGGPGTANGEFIGAGSGSLVLGRPQATASFIVGQSVGGGTAIGTVDWATQTSLTAYSDRWVIGQQVEGVAAADVRLPPESSISASSILIGDRTPATLLLGQSSEIAAGNIVVGRGEGQGQLRVPAGGVLTVGTADQRGDLEIGRVAGDCDCDAFGLLDASAATLVGYFDQIIVGEIDGRPSGRGTLSLSSSPENVLNANLVTLGGAGESPATLAFRGGTASIGSLQGNAITGKFDWTGGRLRVGDVGTAAAPMDLLNRSAGTLVVGPVVDLSAAFGQTTIYGDYEQGPDAVLEMTIGGRAAEAEHDVLKVTGHGAFQGTLAVEFTAGFEPQAGDRFELLDLGSGSGGFNAFVLPNLPPSLGWDTSQLLTSGELRIHTAAIRGRVISDLPNSGDPAWTVYLDSNNNQLRDIGEPFSTTDVNGEYFFPALTSGQYVVRQELPPRWLQISPVAGGAHHVMVSPAGVDGSFDFVNRRLPLVSLTVDRTSISEADGSAIFTAALSAATSVPVIIDLETSGSASSADFSISTRRLIIPAGSTSATAELTAADDRRHEPSESVSVSILTVANGVSDGIQQQTITISDDDPDGVLVTSLEPTPSGFVAGFNRELVLADLNVFDSSFSGGGADATLVGETSGWVDGSLVVDDSLEKVHFVKTGGPLVPDTYTLKLRSGGDAFRDPAGNLLDGDGDGVGGGDFIHRFDVAPQAKNAVTIGLPDFVRGPGEDVNVPPNVHSGIPLTISNGSGVFAIDLRIGYDPALLEINGATVGAEMPEGTSVFLNTRIPGLAILVFFATEALPKGSNAFVNLIARVPADNEQDTYGRKHLLDIHDVVVSDGRDNELPVVEDDGLHLVTYRGDVTANRRVDASDASRVARFAAREIGFDDLPLLDPRILADISGNGRVNALDAARLAYMAAFPEAAAVQPRLAPELTKVAANSPPRKVESPQTVAELPPPAARPHPAAPRHELVDRALQTALVQDVLIEPLLESAVMRLCADLPDVPFK